MKRILFSVLLSASAAVTMAQHPIVISVGGGINNTSSSVKEKGYLGNGYTVQGNVFVPFLHKSNFALGVVAEGTYYTTKHLSQANIPKDFW